MKLEEAAAALGLEPDSSLDQIKAAYRALTASLHPSVCNSQKIKKSK